MNKKEREPQHVQQIDFSTLYGSAIQYLQGEGLAIISELAEVHWIHPEPRIKTAGIARHGGRMGIVYNPEFVARYANTPAKMAGLLAHEVLHSILNHLTEGIYPGIKQVWNIAMDCIINSMLYQISRPAKKETKAEKVFASTAYGNASYAKPGFVLTGLMTDFYKLAGVSALLRPPHALPRMASREKIEDKTIDRMRNLIYLKDKSQSAVSEEDIYFFLVRKFGQEELHRVVTIGLTGEEEELLNDMGYDCGIGRRQALEGAKSCLDTISKQAGHNTEVVDRFSKIAKSKSTDLEKALEQALENVVRAKVIAGIGDSPRTASSVLVPPKISTTDMLKLAGGYYPVFFKSDISTVKRGEVTIYVDVSGSVEQYLPWMYGCIDEAGIYNKINVVLFSNTANPITMKDLKAGKYHTTYGTDFNCIINHALKPENIIKSRKAVIFSDGIANASKENIERSLKSGMTFIAAVFASGPDRWQTEGLAAFCDKVFKVPFKERNRN